MAQIKLLDGKNTGKSLLKKRKRGEPQDEASQSLDQVSEQQDPLLRSTVGPNGETICSDMQDVPADEKLLLESPPEAEGVLLAQAGVSGAAGGGTGSGEGSVAVVAGAAGAAGAAGTAGGTAVAGAVASVAGGVSTSHLIAAGLAVGVVASAPTAAPAGPSDYSTRDSDACVMFGAQRRDVTPDALVPAAGARIFMVGGGSVLPQNFSDDSNFKGITYGVYKHVHDVSLPLAFAQGGAPADKTLQTGIGGMELALDGAAAGVMATANDGDAGYVLGAMALAGYNTAAYGASAVSSLVWLDQLSINLSGAGDALGTVFASARAAADGVAKTAVYELHAHVEADTTAAAIGFVDAFANAGSADASALAAVEICQIEIEASAGLNATAHLQGMSGSQGLVAFAGGNNAVADITVHRHIDLSASVYSEAPNDNVAATAQMGIVYAFAVGSGAAANIVVGEPDEADALVLSVQASAAGEDAYAQASLDGVSANAGADAQAHITLGGGVAVQAQATDAWPDANGRAEAKMGGVLVSAAHLNAVAGVTVLGDVLVEAQATSGYASAVMDTVNVFANDVSADAHLDIGGHVHVWAEGADAFAARHALHAHVSNDNALAQVTIDGDMRVYAHATAVGGAATAFGYAPYVSADNGSGQQVHLSVGGDLLVQAMANAGSGDAIALQGSIMAHAFNVSNADISVTIGGDVVVLAQAFSRTPDLGEARVSQSNIFASAYACSCAAARVSIGGDLELLALADSNATVALYDLYARALNDFNTLAQVDIAGNILLAALVDSGTGLVDLNKVQAMASGASASASMSIGGNVKLLAEGVSQADANLLLASASAKHVNALATVDIGGHLEVSAVATNDTVASANAALSSVHVTVQNGDNAEAWLTIGGDLQVNAQANASYAAAAASLDDIYAYVLGAESASAKVTIGGDVLVTAQGLQTADAIAQTFYVICDGMDSVGQLDVAGSVLLSALAAEGSAAASIRGITALACNVSATAQVTIGADVTVRAQGDTVANANFSTMYAHAIRQEAVAEIAIGGDFLVEAQALGGEASANQDLMCARASAHGAHAHLSIDGNVTVHAEGAAAVALREQMYANVLGVDDALAQVDIGGDVSVLAVATAANASADATHSHISAVANYSGSMNQTAYNAEVRVNINGDVQVRAQANAGNGDAHAFQDHLGALVWGAESATAEVNITGDVIVSAQAFGLSGLATASVDDVNARALVGEGSLARVSMDNMNVIATAGENAHADVGNVFAEAGDLSSVAQLDIAGSILVGAMAGSDAATASVGHIQALASGVNASAEISIGGDLQANALNTGGYAFAGLSAGMGATAQASGALARVSIEDAVIMQARAMGDNVEAQAYLGGFSANASSGGFAQIEVGGDVILDSQAFGANAHASVSFDTLSAQAFGDLAVAQIEVVGHVSVDALAAGANAQAWANLSGFSLSVTGQDALAEVSVGGNITVSAQANGTDSTARATYSGALMRVADDSADAVVSIGGSRHVSAEANALAVADAAGVRIRMFDGYTDSVPASHTSVLNHDVPIGSPVVVMNVQRDAYAHFEIVGDFVVDAVASDAGGRAGALASGADVGEAFAEIMMLSADNGQARIDIGGHIAVMAEGGEARAYMGAQYVYYDSTGQDGSGAYTAAFRIDIESAGNINLGVIDVAGHVLVQASGVSTAVAVFGGVDITLDDGLAATATGTGAYGQVFIDGDLHISAVADAGAAVAVLGNYLEHYDSQTASALQYVVGQEGPYRSAVNLAASMSAYASFEVADDLRISAIGESDAQAYLGRVLVMANGSDSFADFSVNGNIELSATASGVSGAATASVYMIAVNGDNAEFSADRLEIAANASSAHAKGWMYADTGGDIALGNLLVSATGDNHVSVSMEIGAFAGGNVHIGTLSLEAASNVGGSIDLYIGDHHFYRASPADGSVDIDTVNIDLGGNVTADLYVDAMGWDSTRRLDIDGSGDAHVFLIEQAFGVVDLAGAGGNVDLNFDVTLDGEDRDQMGNVVADFDLTVVMGFDVSSDALNFGDYSVCFSTAGMHHTNWSNFTFTALSLASIGSDTALTGLLGNLQVAISTGAYIAYGQYTGGPTTIHGQSVIDDSNYDWWLVVYDDDGIGLTSLVLLQVGEGQNPETALYMQPI